MANAVGKALEILSRIGENPEQPVLLGDLAEHLGYNQSTCACVLKTLVEYGFVDQPSPRKGYTLGPMAYYIARRGAYRKDIVTVAGPSMDELAARTGETVLLAALRRDRRVLLAVVEGNQEVQIRPAGSFLDDVYITATGRLLLAYLPDAEREAFFAKRGQPGAAWPEAATPAKLDRILATARRDGYMILRAPQHVQVAFPVFEAGQAVAALGLPVPAFRFTAATEPALVAAARDTAAAISAKLPYRKGGTG